MDENSKFDRRIFAKYLIAFVVLISLLTGINSANINAQSLSQIRSDVRASPTPAPAEPDRKKKDHDHDCDDDDDGNFVSNLVGAVFFGSSNDNHSHSHNHASHQQSNDIDYEIYASPEPAVTFLDFPYQGDRQGISMTDSGLGKLSQLRTAFWYSTDFDNIDSWNTQFQYQGQGILGLDFQWSHLTEKLSGVSRDSLNLADINLTFRWLESENFISRAGIGANFLIDRFGTEIDTNFTLSTDFFPVEPLIIGFEIDYGKIGQATHTHLLTTAGVNFNHVEWLTGYEYRRIGTTEIYGPLMGMRVWW